MQDLAVLAELLAVVGSHGDQGVVEVAAGAQRFQHLADLAVRLRGGQLVELPGPLPEIGVEGPGRVREGPHLERGDSLRQIVPRRVQAVEVGIVSAVGRVRRQDVHPHELRSAVERRENLRHPFHPAHRSETVEAADVAEGLGEPGVRAEGRVLVAESAEDLRQGRQVVAQVGAGAVPRAVPPGLPAGEQRRHGRHRPARRRDRRARPVGLGREPVQVRHQAGAGQVGAQRVDRDQDDRPAVNRRRLGAAGEERRGHQGAGGDAGGGPGGRRHGGSGRAWPHAG